jgi:hypothetical protein
VSNLAVVGARPVPLAGEVLTVEIGVDDCRESLSAVVRGARRDRGVIAGDEVSTAGLAYETRASAPSVE